MNKMKIQPELCGYTLEKFNKLMFRLSKFSPDWANHIKVHNNIKQNDSHINGLDKFHPLDIEDWIETIFLNNKNRSLANAKTCIVGETYHNRKGYQTKYGKSYCCECTFYSVTLFDRSTSLLEDGTTSHITDLKTLDEYVTHLEEKHKNLIKVEIK